MSLQPFLGPNSHKRRPLLLYFHNGSSGLFNASLWTKFSPIFFLVFLLIFFFLWRCGPTRAMASSFLRFLDHTQRRITVGRTRLYEWSARRRDLYLTTHSTHNRQKSMPPGGIRTHNHSRWAAADLRLRPRGHWGRLPTDFALWNFTLVTFHWDPFFLHCYEGTCPF